ncbi:hypothetical protein Gotur_032896 [Gossypium turneri]
MVYSSVCGKSAAKSHGI